MNARFAFYATFGNEREILPIEASDNAAYRATPTTRLLDNVEVFVSHVACRGSHVIVGKNR